MPSDETVWSVDRHGFLAELFLFFTYLGWLFCNLVEFLLFICASFCVAILKPSGSVAIEVVNVYPSLICFPLISTQGYKIMAVVSAFLDGNFCGSVRYLQLWCNCNCNACNCDIYIKVVTLLRYAHLLERLATAEMFHQTPSASLTAGSRISKWR